MQQPLVSVIINCYNGEKYLNKAIDSVYAQTYLNWEIIFWDNVSTDLSAVIAKSYDNRLNYFLANQTIPLYNARNKAISKANGKYLAFLDCDDVWFTDKLEKMMRFISLLPNSPAYASNIRYLKHERYKKSLYPMSGGEVLTRSFSDLINKYDIAMSSVIIDRDLFLKNGGFDKEFKFTGDKEFLVRMSLTNPIYITGDVLTGIRIHNENLTSSNINSFSNENYMLIVKILQDNPKIFDKDIALLLTAIYKVIFQKSVQLWKDGKSANSRGLILSSLLPIKFLLLLLVTFIPSVFYITIVKIYKTL